MKALWALLLCLSVLTATTRSETPLRLFGGLSAGYVAFAPTSRTIGPLSLPLASEQFGSVTTVTFGLHVGVEAPLSNSFSARATFGGSYMAASIAASEPTLFNVRGTAVPGSFEHNADVEWRWITATTSVAWHVNRFLNIELGAGAAIPLNGKISATESIVDPVGITYVDGGTTRTTADGSIENTASVIGSAFGRIYAQWNASNGVVIEPGLYGNLILASFTEAAVIRPSSAGLSVSVSFGITKPTEKSTRVSRVRTDTVIVVDAYDPTVRDVRYIEVSRSFETDTLRQRSGLTIVDNTVVRLEKHLPSPPPFLSIVLRADLDTTLNASVPHVVVQTDVATDEGVRSMTVHGIVNSDTVWTTTSLQEMRGPIQWSFADLPPRYRESEAFTIRVEASVTDTRGQVQQARPASLYIKHTVRR